MILKSTQKQILQIVKINWKNYVLLAVVVQNVKFVNGHF